MAATTAVNPDLQWERDQATFDPIQLTYLLDDGPEKTRRKRYLQSLAISSGKIQESRSWHELSREERYEEAMRKAVYCADRVKELQLKDPMDIYIFNQTFLCHENSPFGLHNSMFSDIVIGQGSKEQCAKWLPLIRNYQILGTYAQTELGHGTFVRGLETTATYDRNTEEFVINSPTLTSIKFWPGALGKTSNHTVVIAQLYTQGRCQGLQSFIVPIRRLDNHKPLPGIEVGDIGLKFGYDSMDNGFLRMTNVRIPRENMLMKHAQVTREGEFIKARNDKLLYGGMVLIRTFITGDVGRALSHACTIAIRYSAVRRQTSTVPGEKEKKVLDYQTQQYKLLPALATSFAYIFAGKTIRDVYLRVMAQIEKGSTEELPHLHALSAGLKACSSSATTAMMETCRMACGGHGYSHASGIPKIYVNMTPACTYEGENTVLLLQTARYLMKHQKAVSSGQSPPSSLQYLIKSSGGVSSLDERLEFSAILDVFEHRAARLIRECGEKMERLARSGNHGDDVWNLTSVQLVKASQAHVECCVVKIFISYVEEKEMDSAVRVVLRSLCRLYALHLILQYLGEFLQDGYLIGRHVELINSAFLRLLSEIRPNAVAVVDGFDIPDVMLGSALGRYDGQVYEALYNYAKQSQLNKTQVSDAYYKHLKPFLDRRRKGDNPVQVTSRL